jgi:peptidyl-prolyl cis-trans isomerase SurA
VNREVKSKIVITKEDIKAYYDSHREKYAGDKKYYIWNLFIKTSGAGNEQALREMKGVENQLSQGASIETIVQKLKESSAPVQGTDLGLYRIDELSEELQAVVTKLKANEFSEILDTNFGYQIIYVQKIEDTPPKPLEAVESEIQEQLYNEFVDDRYQVWLEELRTRSHIRIIN